MKKIIDNGLFNITKKAVTIGFEIVLVLFLTVGCSTDSSYEIKNDHYEGQFCEGEGDVDFLRLIDESFAFFEPNPVVPNISMLYSQEWDGFEEGAGWGMWWIQNSYGFSYSATPFLAEPWFSML